MDWLVSKAKVLKIAGIWLFCAGLFTIIVPTFLFILTDMVTKILAIPAILAFILVGASEVTSGTSVYRLEQGVRKGAQNTLILVLVFRGLWFLLAPFDVLTVWVMAVFLFFAVGEIVILVSFLRKHGLFEEAKLEKWVEDRCLVPAMKTAATCPSCHEVVEISWQSCPYCGTRLPRLCASCGKDMGVMLTKCPHCGVEITCSDSLKKTIDTFQALAMENALPETKATRYARLAEALLKDGRAEDAVVAYKKAAEYTVYNRKKANFFLRTAVILKNTGKKDEALSILDQVDSIDPEDKVGAKELRNEILSAGTSVPATEKVAPA